MAIYGYLRTSTKKQDIKLQKQLVNDACKLNGWEVDEWFEDFGVSAWDYMPFDRKGFMQMYNKLQKGDLVVIHYLDRLIRNVSISLAKTLVDFIQRALLNKGVELYVTNLDFVYGGELIHKPQKYYTKSTLKSKEECEKFLLECEKDNISTILI